MRQLFLKYAFFVLSFSVVLVSCGGSRHNETKTNDDYLNKEIADRVALLNKDTAFSEELVLLNKNVNNLLYLTIDIENIGASIAKSNQFFPEAAKAYKVDTAGFVTLYKGLPLPEIITSIKRNHLNLLNKIILVQNKNGELMLPAQ